MAHLHWSWRWTQVRTQTRIPNPNGYIVLCRTCSYCTDLDSHPYSLFLERTGIRVQIRTCVRLQQCKWTIRFHSCRAKVERKREIILWSLLLINVNSQLDFLRIHLEATRFRVHFRLVWIGLYEVVRRTQWIQKQFCPLMSLTMMSTCRSADPGPGEGDAVGGVPDHVRYPFRFRSDRVVRVVVFSGLHRFFNHRSFRTAQLYSIYGIYREWKIMQQLQTSKFSSWSLHLKVHLY